MIIRSVLESIFEGTTALLLFLLIYYLLFSFVLHLIYYSCVFGIHQKRAEFVHFKGPDNYQKNRMEKRSAIMRENIFKDKK